MAHYAFHSRWDLPAPPERVWELITGWLRGEHPALWRGVRLETPFDDAVAGARGELVVRSPFGYGLRIALTLIEVDEPRRLAASSAGDLRGSGELTITGGSAHDCHADIRWDVTTERGWMNRSAAVLAPLFRVAHRIVMARGARALRRALGSPGDQARARR